MSTQHTEPAFRIPLMLVGLNWVPGHLVSSSQELRRVWN